MNLPGKMLNEVRLKLEDGMAPDEAIVYLTDVLDLRIEDAGILVNSWMEGEYVQG